MQVLGLKPQEGEVGQGVRPDPERAVASPEKGAAHRDKLLNRGGTRAITPLILGRFY